jgi:predicted KAP-like P-loop ATPase
MRYSDQPISRPGEDVLGRSGFALELARSIDNLSVAGDGFVMALVGEWGAGKTSVIELVIRYLRHIEMERVTRHWLTGDERSNPLTIEQIELLAIEFDRIRLKVEAVDELNLDTTKWQREYRWTLFRSLLNSDESADAADRYWRLKLRVEANPKTVVVRFSPWLIAGKAELATALLSELARALGKPFGNDIRRAFGTVIERLSHFLPAAGTGVDLATGYHTGGLFSAGGLWSRKIAEAMTSGPTLDGLRHSLRSMLRRLNEQRVLVVVDDVDRLTPQEALQMVSLVKSVGDLPNVVYLLSYHDLKLAELINTAIDVDGHEFLQKIVQYTAILPPLDDDDLRRLFKNDLLAILGDVSEEDQIRFDYQWYYVLRFYLRRPRDVRRFINALAVAQSNLGDYTDIMDLIIVTALQLFEPNVYWQMRRHIFDLAS